MKLEQIKSILESVSGCTFSSFDATTVPVLTGGKSNPHQGNITKVTKNNRVILFATTNTNGYENMINKLLGAEGKTPNFSVGVLPWGERVANLPLISHNGKFYLQAVFLNAGTSEYFLNGKPIDKADVIGLKSDNPGKAQGLDEHAVFIRTFALENIDAIRLMGENVQTIAPRKVSITQNTNKLAKVL